MIISEVFYKIGSDFRKTFYYILLMEFAARREGKEQGPLLRNTNCIVFTLPFQKYKRIGEILHLCLSLVFLISVPNSPTNGKCLFSKGTNEEFDMSKVK